jgi:uncharacterized membrane protein YdcZ (DUF606 family)
MLKIIFPLLALIGGMPLATQGQINGGLGKKSVCLKVRLLVFQWEP